MQFLTDFREDKLPNWAKALLEKERKFSDFRWPQTEERKPLFSCSADGFVTYGIKPKNTWIWHVQNSFDNFVAVKSWISDTSLLLYRDQAMSPFGNRAHGDYYVNKREACLAALWRQAELSAIKMHEAANRLREAGNDTDL